MGLLHYFLFLTSIVFTNAQYIKHEDLEWKCGEITCPPRNTQEKDTKSLANSEYENQNARKCCDFCKSNGSLYCLKYLNESLGFNLLFEKGNDKECFCSNQVPDGCIYSEDKKILRNVKICQNRLKAGLRPSIQQPSIILSQEYLIVKIVKPLFGKELRNLKLHYAYQISDNMNHTRECELIYHDEKLDKNKSYICEQWEEVEIQTEKVEIPREDFEGANWARIWLTVEFVQLRQLTLSNINNPFEDVVHELESEKIVVDLNDFEEKIDRPFGVSENEYLTNITSSSKDEGDNFLQNLIKKNGFLIGLATGIVMAFVLLFLLVCCCYCIYHLETSRRNRLSRSRNEREDLYTADDIHYINFNKHDV